MKARVVEVKDWCESNISPLAWKRVVLRSLPSLSEHGLDLDELENPKNTLILETKELKMILSAIDELYGIEIPTSKLIVA